MGLAAIFVGYFSVSKNTQPIQTEKLTVELPPQRHIPNPEPQVNPLCPDTDYTGCDNSSEWMTWNGELAQNTPPPGSSLLEK